MEYKIGLLCVAVAVLLAPYVESACPGGQATNWCSQSSRRISQAADSIDNTGITVQQCQQACITRGTCQSVTFMQTTPTSCRFHTQTQGQFTTMVESGSTVYWYVCGSMTCQGMASTPEPETSAEPRSEPETTPEQEPESSAEPEQKPENTPEPEGESEITPEQFWKWLRDEPVWFALIGMGVFIFLLFIIILVLVCRLRDQK